MAIATSAFVLRPRGPGFRNPGLVDGDVEYPEELSIWKNSSHAFSNVGSEAIRSRLRSFPETISNHVLKKPKLVNSIEPMWRLMFRHRRVSRRKISWKKI
jgi:hypothetical protein